MNDENDKTKHERQFKGRLNQQGKLDLEDLVKEMDSVHSQYVQSYWRVKDRDKR